VSKQSPKWGGGPFKNAEHAEGESGRQGNVSRNAGGLRRFATGKGKRTNHVSSLTAERKKKSDQIKNFEEQ